MTQNGIENSRFDLVDAIVEGIRRKKGLEIVNIDLTTGEEAECDNFIICHGSSNVHVDAIARSVEESVVDTAAKDALVARGIIIDTNGTAITDRQSIDPTLSYEAIMADGSRLPLEIQNPIATSTSFMTVVLKVSTTTPALTAAAFADTSKLALGQTVLRIGGDGEDVVGEGVISSLPSSGVFVRAEVGSTVAGSVLINMFGEVVGITTTESLAKSSTFYSIPPASKVATLSVAPASAPAHADQTNVASVAAGAANSKIKSTK